MLKRPSSRGRGSHAREVQLNLVPILDSLITLISFLMLSMSLLSIVSIESPFPITSPEEVAQKLQEKPLQLTVSLRESAIELWSPFEKIPTRTIPYKPDGKPDTQALHEALIQVKNQFPDETKIVMVPTSKTNYESLIVLMDAIRTLEKTDPPVFRKNPATGNDEAVKVLFPDVVFGNLLGDT